MTKIDIFSGFLGAGKTTLIKKLIKEAYKGEKVVLIENEFGEIGIDGGFMQDAGIKVNEMNSGCICCSLVGDFEKALEKVLSEYAPDRILIEPSGVGKLSDVIRAVRSINTKDAVLNTFCCVADAGKCKMYIKNFGEFYNDQIEHASAIILSHTDTVSSEKAEESVQLIREHNKNAQLITTPLSQLDGAEILSVMENKDTLKKEIEKLLSEEDICPECGHHHDHDHEHHHDHEHEHEHEPEHEHEHEHEHHHHHHHADDVFSNWGVETVRIFDKEALTEALKKLSDSEKYGTVLRAKGIVNSADGWLHFDYVPGEPDVRFGSASAIGRLCVIGTKLNEEALKELFGL